ncbi:MarR family transcriptional regulator [bacterium]|nr:MarR family transcriptional regulator [bacterium]
MTKKKELFIKIFDKQITRLVNKWNILEKKPKDYETGDLLYPSEIHTISAIEENPDLHMSEIAKLLGVTRGAIMQLAVKLEKKQLVERFMMDHNNKKVFFKLTTKGKKAYGGHEKYHRQMYDDLYLYLKTLKVEELKLFEDVFERIENHVDSYLKEKK